MGNTDSKTGSGFSPRTLRNQAVFKKISKSKSFITSNDLKEAWDGKIDERLRDMLLKYLFAKNNELRFNEYNEVIGTLLQGSLNEKSDVILKLLSTLDKNHREGLHRYLDCVFHNVCTIETSLPKNCIKCWDYQTKSEKSFVHLIGFYLNLLGSDATLDEKNMYPVMSALDPMNTLVYGKIFGSEDICSSFFPKWLRLSADRDKTLGQCSILTLEDVLFLNSLLPVDWQLEWRLLFSSKIHGESFSRLSGQIVNQGATLIIVRDKDDYVFGGFAPCSWSLNPNFVGDSTSFLFTLRPKMNVYNPSNFNSNFQYLNQGQQTLPNGLGMGGKLEYFGLWLDCEYGIGISNDSCTTYRNFTRLSKEKEFRCAEVEVWGVGEPPQTASELGERSVLDGNTEAKAMLELAGRKTYSDGLREEPKD